MMTVQQLTDEVQVFQRAKVYGEHEDQTFSVYGQTL